jgi:hypothetical protein
MVSIIPPSELDLYLSLVSLLTKGNVPEPTLQVDCCTRFNNGVNEYLVYASRAAKLILANRLEKDLRRSLDVALDEWVLSVEEAKAIAGHRLW